MKRIILLLLPLLLIFPNSVYASTDALILKLQQQLESLRLQLVSLEYENSYPFTLSAVMTDNISSTSLKKVKPVIPKTFQFRITPNSESFIQNRTTAKIAINPYQSAAGITTGNLYTEGGQYTLNAQGNALPMKINKAKNTYFLTSELPKDIPNGSDYGFYSSRSEARIGVSTLRPNKDYYFAFDLFIDKVSDLKSGTKTDWRLIQQIIQEHAKNSPVLSLNLNTAGNFVLVRRTREDSYEALVELPASKGVWHRFEYEFKLGEKGYLHAWLDGVLIYSDKKDVVFTYCGKNIDCSTASPKLGIYRSYSGSMGYNKISYKDILLGEK
jgi:hypothetical protein